MKPTLKDVAKKAGVSVTTASLVLGGKGRISSETRKFVLDSAQELGYETPKQKNSNSQRSEKGMVGVLFSIEYEWAFIWVLIQPILYEMERKFRRAGFSMVILPITNSSSDEKILKEIDDSEAMGVIAMHYGNEPLFITLERRGIPVVVVMNSNFQDTFYSVCVDDFQGAYEGTRHLIKLGHEQIGFIDTKRPDLPQLSMDRFIGFKKALDEFHVKFNDDHRLYYDPAREEDFSRDIARLITLPNAPSALFCLDDELAAHVITELSNLGLRVPEDISIIAPGDVLDFSQPYIPKITTMKINTTLMGSITADMMISRIRHTEEDIHVLKVKQQLVQRSSCKPFV